MFERFNGNVVPFADESTSTNRTVFGSEAQSDDIDDNLNSDFKKGWEIVGLNDNPTREDFNAMGYTLGYLTSYLYQNGVAEYNLLQEYKTNSIAIGTDGNIYQSLVDNNLGNALTDTTKWVCIASKNSIVNSIAELKTISNIESINVLGYYEKGDGGGGLFYWDNTSTEIDNGGTIIQATGITTGRWKRVYSDSVNVKWFGAKGDGVADDTVAIQNAINNVYDKVIIPYGTYLCGNLNIPKNTNITGTGTLLGKSGASAILIFNDSLYCKISNITLLINEPNQIGIDIKSTDGFSQLNEFRDIVLVGVLNTNVGSIGISIDNSFSNNFFGVIVNKVSNGVRFSNGANANHFYGGEIRGDNSNSNHQKPIIHNSNCMSNGFHGTVIENCREPITINGGVVSFDSGCYIEAFYSASTFNILGGSVKIIGNYLNNTFIFISNGENVFIHGNTFDGVLSSDTYPFVSFRADVSTKLSLIGNHTTEAVGRLYIERMFYDGASYVYRSIGNINEIVQQDSVKFQARLASDIVNCTGDGTAVDIVWNGNQQFDDGSNIGNYFVAPENGIYLLQATIYLAGLDTSAFTNTYAYFETSNRTYYFYIDNIGTGTTGGAYTIEGTALVDMEKNDYAKVKISIAGGTKTVAIKRGDATNGYTVFSGAKL